MKGGWRLSASQFASRPPAVGRLHLALRGVVSTQHRSLLRWCGAGFEDQRSPAWQCAPFGVVPPAPPALSHDHETVTDAETVCVANLLEDWSTPWLRSDGQAAPATSLPSG